MNFSDRGWLKCSNVPSIIAEMCRALHGLVMPSEFLYQIFPFFSSLTSISRYFHNQVVNFRDARKECLVKCVHFVD